MTADAVETRPQARVAEAAILGAFVFVVAVGIAVHEPWFDEAQSWLLARDSSLGDLLNTYLRYEGHPPLWYLLLKIPTSLGLPYKSINFVGALIALTGVILLLSNREIPLVVKALLPFNFFVAYQYTIVSRSYVLILPLLLGILAIYRERRQRLWTFVVLLVLLCQVSLHGTSIAGALVVLYTWDVRREIPKGAELRKHLLALGVLLLNVAAIAWILRPPGDLSIKPKLDFHFSAQRMTAIALHSLWANTLGSDSLPAVVLSSIAALLLLVWFWRRGTLGVFVVLYLSLLPISNIYFGIWHEGLFNAVILFSILLTLTRAQRERFDLAMLALVALLLLKSVWATWQSYAFDINAPYSGSLAAADFIKEHRIDRSRFFGAGFPCLGIEPYFDHNVFANYRTYGHFTFWDWSGQTPWFYRTHETLKIADLRAWMTRQLAQRPDFVLISAKFRSDPEYANVAAAAGYRQIAVFPGALFWKDHIIEEETYRLFARPDHVLAR
jgi:hypothetical protein